MKLVALVIALALGCFSAGSLCGAESVGETIATGLGRGLVNIVTSPAELGHHIVYDTADINVPGVLTGTGKGLVFMLGRCVAGLGDVLTLGYIPPQYNLYKSFYMQEYVWEEQWLPPRKTVQPQSAPTTTLESVAHEPEQPVSQSTLPEPDTEPAYTPAPSAAEEHLKPLEKIYPDR